MSHHDEKDTDRDEQSVGPTDNTDDATQSDAGMTGPPAHSASPLGHGDDPHESGAEREDDEEPSPAD